MADGQYKAWLVQPKGDSQGVYIMTPDLRVICLISQNGDLNLKMHYVIYGQPPFPWEYDWLNIVDIWRSEIQKKKLVGPFGLNVTHPSQLRQF